MFWHINKTRVFIMLITKYKYINFRKWLMAFFPTQTPHTNSTEPAESQTIWNNKWRQKMAHGLFPNTDTTHKLYPASWEPDYLEQQMKTENGTWPFPLHWHHTQMLPSQLRARRSAITNEDIYRSEGWVVGEAGAEVKGGKCWRHWRCQSHAWTSIRIQSFKQTDNKQAAT